MKYDIKFINITYMYSCIFPIFVLQYLYSYYSTFISTEYYINYIMLLI